MAACIQNACKAGILVRAPTKKAKASQIAAVVIDGPTSLNPLETLSIRYLSSCLSIEFLMMNMLSTPIASIKKGMTYALIIENPIPRKEINPIDANTEAKTMAIPMIASVNPDPIFEGKTPIAIPMYINMAL